MRLKYVKQHESSDCCECISFRRRVLCHRATASGNIPVTSSRKSRTRRFPPSSTGTAVTRQVHGIGKGIRHPFHPLDTPAGPVTAQGQIDSTLDAARRYRSGWSGTPQDQSHSRIEPDSSTSIHATRRSPFPVDYEPSGQDWRRRRSNGSWIRVLG